MDFNYHSNPGEDQGPPFGAALVLLFSIYKLSEQGAAKSGLQF